MNVSLTPELEAAVKARVASGRYNNASEVVRDALRALGSREERERKLEHLRALVAQGHAEIEAGKGIAMDVDEMFDLIESEIDAEMNLAGRAS